MTPDEPRLLRSSAIVAAGSLLSRVTGLVRVWALINAVGAVSRLAGAYNAANNSPNIVYELAVGGVLSASLVPLLVERLDREDRDGVSAVVSVAVVALGLLTVVAVLAAPLVGALFGLGVSGADTAGYGEVLTRLLRWMLPQIYFYGLVTVAGALLNARRRFVAAAFAPVVNNLVATVAFLTLPLVVKGDLLGDRPLAVALAEPRTLLWLGLGTTLGVVASAAVLTPVFADRGLGLRFRPDLRHPLIGRLVRLSGWTVAYVGVNQVSSMATILMANVLPNGTIAAYDYAYIFFIVPHGLLAVSFMTALTPELARAGHRGDIAGLRRQWADGLRLTAVLMFPAAAGLFVLAHPVVDVLVSRSEDVALTASVLRAFAVGLAGFSLYLYSLRPFYAQGDARNPFRLNVVENAVQVVLTVVLGFAFDAAGLGLAHSVAYLVAAVVGFSTAARRLGRLPLSWVRPLGPMAFAALAMGVIMAAALTVAGWVVGNLPALVELLVGIAVGLPTYLVYLRRFGGAADLDPLLARARALAGR